MNLLLLGAYRSVNLGDAVICDCVAAWLREAYPDARLDIRDMVSRNRGSVVRFPGKKELQKRRLRGKLRTFAARNLGVDLILRRENRRIGENRAHLDAVCAGDYDAVIFAGGQLFMDGYGAFLAYCTEKFSQRNIPVFFNACGTGPADSKAVTRRLSAALSLPNVRFISCRDNVPVVTERYRPALTVLQTADPALTAGEVFGVCRDKGSETVGLGVMYPSFVPAKTALKFWQNVIRALEKRGQRWQLFSNGDPADVVFAQQIVSSMPELKGRSGCIAPPDREPGELMRTIASYESLISFRLHSHIIAASLDIPTAAVVWDEKLPLFFHKIGFPDRCLTVNADADQVLQVLDSARKTGYDRELLKSLSLQAKQQLLSALEKEGRK